MNTIKGIDIEKLLTIKTFFLLLSFSLYIDSVMLIFSNLTIKDISFPLLKHNLGNALVILSFYAFFLSIIVGSLIYFLRQVSFLLPNSIYSKIYKYDYTKDEDLHYNFKLKDLAIKHNNSVLYDVYKENNHLEHSTLTLKYLSVSIMVFSTINYFFSDENNTSLVHIYLNYLISIENTFFPMLLNLIFILILISTLFVSMMSDTNYKKVYLKKNVLDFIEKDNASNDNGACPKGSCLCLLQR